jgi:hypothetical protein
MDRPIPLATAARREEAGPVQGFDGRIRWLRAIYQHSRAFPGFPLDHDGKYGNDEGVKL